MKPRSYTTRPLPARNRRAADPVESLRTTRHRRTGRRGPNGSRPYPAAPPELRIADEEPDARIAFPRCVGIETFDRELQSGHRVPAERRPGTGQRCQDTDQKRPVRFERTTTRGARNQGETDWERTATSRADGHLAITRPSPTAAIPGMAIGSLPPTGISPANAFTADISARSPKS